MCVCLCVPLCVEVRGQPEGDFEEEASCVGENMKAWDYIFLKKLHLECVCPCLCVCVSFRVC